MLAALWNHMGNLKKKYAWASPLKEDSDILALEYSLSIRIFQSYLYNFNREPCLKNTKLEIVPAEL